MIQDWRSHHRLAISALPFVYNRIPQHQRVAKYRESVIDTITLSKDHCHNAISFDFSKTPTVKEGHIPNSYVTPQNIHWDFESHISIDDYCHWTFKQSFNIQNSHGPSTERIHYLEYLLKQQQGRRLKEQDEACCPTS